jgi:hypothetical protein
MPNPDPRLIRILESTPTRLVAQRDHDGAAFLWILVVFFLALAAAFLGMAVVTAARRLFLPGGLFLLAGLVCLYFVRAPGTDYRMTIDSTTATLVTQTLRNDREISTQTVPLATVALLRVKDEPGHGVLMAVLKDGSAVYPFGTVGSTELPTQYLIVKDAAALLPAASLQPGTSPAH